MLRGGAKAQGHIKSPARTMMLSLAAAPASTSAMMPELRMSVCAGEVGALSGTEVRRAIAVALDERQRLRRARVARYRVHVDHLTTGAQPGLQEVC
jgi:hypothetical protein